MRRVRKEDMVEIGRWNDERGLPPLDFSVYPMLGFIEPGVAAGFMHRTDTSIAIFENFISNPQADKVKAREVMGEIAKALEEAVKILGFKYSTAVINIKSIEDLAIQNGMKLIGAYRVYRKEL